MNDLGNLITKVLLGGESVRDEYNCLCQDYVDHLYITIPFEVSKTMQYMDVQNSGVMTISTLKDMKGEQYKLEISDFENIGYNEYIEARGKPKVLISNIYMPIFIKVRLRCLNNNGLKGDYMVNVSYDNCMFETGKVTSAKYHNCLDWEGRTV